MKKIDLYQLLMDLFGLSSLSLADNYFWHTAHSIYPSFAHFLALCLRLSLALSLSIYPTLSCIWISPYDSLSLSDSLLLYVTLSLPIQLSPVSEFLRDSLSIELGISLLYIQYVYLTHFILFFLLDSFSVLNFLFSLIFSLFILPYFLWAILLFRMSH